MGEPVQAVALLAGASGLTGGHLLAALLEAPDFTRVYAVTRRPLRHGHPRLANRIAQFERLEEQLQGVACQTAFCCLGAQPQATREEARSVEFGYTLAFARAARRARAERFVFLSCANARGRAARSALPLRQQTERALERLGFTSLDILQPAALLGLHREVRGADLMACLAAPFIRLASFGARAPQRSIAAHTVAAAMLGAARSGRRGVYRYTYSGIQALARSPLRWRSTRANRLEA